MSSGSRHLDLRELDSVAAFADAITGPVDLLIANVGVSKTPDAHLANGLDVRFATNHLGHFSLALRLHAQMAERGAWIVMVSSAAHKGVPVHLDDLQWQSREHIAGMAYAESKSANILFAQEATRRWSADGIFANAVLPGSALTGLQRFHGEELKRQIGFILPDGSLNPVLKTVEQAAATTLWAATAPELEGRGGLVLEDCAEALPVGPDTHPWSGYDASVADRRDRAPTLGPVARPAPRAQRRGMTAEVSGAPFEHGTARVEVTRDRRAVGGADGLGIDVTADVERVRTAGVEATS